MVSACHLYLFDIIFHAMIVMTCPHTHVYGHAHGHAYRHAVGMCDAMLESSHRGGDFECRHVSARNIDMPVGDADMDKSRCAATSAR